MDSVCLSLCWLVVALCVPKDIHELPGTVHWYLDVFIFRLHQNEVLWESFGVR